METIYNEKTKEYFKVSDSDFDSFQFLFATKDINNEECAFIYYEINDDESEFEREYSEDEVKAIFWLHAELTGLDVEIKKNEVSSLSNRVKARKELEDFIKTKKPISIKTAKEVLKIIKSFEETI